jgi:hypothetical protein
LHDLLSHSRNSRNSRLKNLKETNDEKPNEYTAQRSNALRPDTTGTKPSRAVCVNQRQSKRRHRHLHPASTGCGDAQTRRSQQRAPAQGLSERESSVSTPMLFIVISWFAIIFVSLSLFAPPNLTVVIALMLAVFSVSGAIFLILELDQPFDGIIQISSAPMRNALQHLGQR